MPGADLVPQREHGEPPQRPANCRAAHWTDARPNGFQEPGQGSEYVHPLGRPQNVPFGTLRTVGQQAGTGVQNGGTARRSQAGCRSRSVSSPLLRKGAPGALVLSRFAGPNRVSGSSRPARGKWHTPHTVCATSHGGSAGHPPLPVPPGATPSWVSSSTWSKNTWTLVILPSSNS